jgi:sulfoxide reductase heme-binding subunit YedZ
MKGPIKPLVFLLCLSPALWLTYGVMLALTGGENLLGPDPAQFLALQTGTWSIRLLIAALAVTPLRYLLNAPYIWQFRRMLGLFAFFYVTLHFLVFLAFLLQWQWQDLGREIAERPYITFGFLAFVLLVPLGMTSVQFAQRKLGRRWKKLHRLVYVINILAVLHVTWIVRSSIADALLYGLLVLLLLGYRLLRHKSATVRQFSLRRAPKAPVRTD